MYSQVQFIGYAIPSVPLSLGSIGIGYGSFAEGRYIGIEPVTADLDARIALAMSAIEQTVKSGAVDQSPSTLKIFVMPEFTFRGKRGAYDNDPPNIDAFAYFRTEIAKRVTAYDGWLFVFGTIIEATNYVRGTDQQRDEQVRVRENVAMALADAWQHSQKANDDKLANNIDGMLDEFTTYCRLNPVYEVTNRSYVVPGGPAGAAYPEGLSVEKRFISNEDFVLNATATGFGGDECAYPPIAENNGEDKQTAFDDLCIFTIDGIKIGVEICLDHASARLRQNRIPDTELVQIHIVPSCGMQLLDSSLIAGPGGLGFNCDGQYATPMPGIQPDPAYSIWSGTADGRAHTHLAQVVTPCSSGKDGTGAVSKSPAAKLTTVTIQNPAADAIYAYGPGEVHVYSPLPVPPPVP